MTNTKRCSTFIALTSMAAIGHAAGQDAATKGTTEPLHFKPADACVRAMLAPVKELQGVLKVDSPSRSPTWTAMSGRQSTSTPDS